MPFLLRVESFCNDTRRSVAELPAGLFNTLDEAEMAKEQLAGMVCPMPGRDDDWLDGPSASVDEDEDGKGWVVCRIFDVEPEIVSRPFRPSQRIVDEFTVPTIDLPPLQPLKAGEHAWVLLAPNREPVACYAALGDAEIAMAAFEEFPEEFQRMYEEPHVSRSACIVKVPVGGVPRGPPTQWLPEARVLGEHSHLPDTLKDMLVSRKQARAHLRTSRNEIHQAHLADLRVAEDRQRALLFLRSLPMTSSWTPRARATATRAHSAALRAIAADPTEDPTMRENAEGWLRANADNRECSVLRVQGRNIEWTAEDVDV